MDCDRQQPSPTGDGRPYNSLHVISDRGELVGRYDKRLCSFNEAAHHYNPGAHPLVFAVDDVRFGCALCIEVNFPELFSEYEQLGVDCVLFSAHADDPIFGLLAQAHAATNCYWVSMSTPADCAAQLPAWLIGPDGQWIAQCAREVRAALVIRALDRNAPAFDVALNKARPWRHSARYERAKATNGREAEVRS